MATALPRDETALLMALRDGDEAAFMAVVEAWGPSMLRLARAHVSSQAIAEEVVQEAWVGDPAGARSLRGALVAEDVGVPDRGQHRQDARGRGVAQRAVLVSDGTGTRRRRSIPIGSGPPTIAIRGAGRRRPSRGPSSGSRQAETRDAALAAIAGLPPRQREIITLRDIAGFSAEEACNALDISETNQRVLLHRARSKVRGALEGHFDAEKT